MTAYDPRSNGPASEQASPEADVVGEAAGPAKGRIDSRTSTDDSSTSRTTGDPAAGNPGRDRVEDRPLTSLLTELASETTLLFRKEVELAKAELSEKVGQAVRGAIGFAVGGAVAFIGLMFLFWAAVYGLAVFLPLWAAALIVGGVVVGIGLWLIGAGRRRLAVDNLEPKRTVQTLKEDADWAKAQVRR